MALAAGGVQQPFAGDAKRVNSSQSSQTNTKVGTAAYRGNRLISRWPSLYKNAIVLTPETSNRFRQRKFLQATLSSIKTM